MKFTKYFMAAALAVLAMGCNKEQVAVEGTPDGQEVTVTFTAGLPGTPATKAIGDGTTAKNLTVAVYEDANNAAGNHLNLDQTATFTDLKATVNFSLVKGKTYHFIFWAQATGAPYTFDKENKEIAVSYAGDANDESRDAFFAVKTVKVTGAMTEPVELHRPFAQVNFGTADFVAAQAAGVEPKTSVVVATDVATVFDPFKGEGKNPTTVTGTVSTEFTAAAIPTDPETLTVEGKGYKYLAMNYIIPTGLIGEKHVTNLTATFTDAAGQNVEVSVPSAPVQTNWRTNIVGNLLTDQIVFNVEIKPAFEDEENIDLQNINSAVSLRAALATGGAAKLTADIDITDAKAAVVEAGKSVILDLNGHSISNSVDIWNDTYPEGDPRRQNCLITVAGGTLTIKGQGKIAAKANDCYTFNVKDNGKLVIEDGEFVGNVSVIQVQEGVAEVYGGKFSLAQTWAGAGSYGCDYMINMIDSMYVKGKANAIVYGGEFEKFNPADCAAEEEHTNFVAPGYKATNISTDPNAPVYAVTMASTTPVTSQEGMNTAITGATKGQPATVVLPSNAAVTLDNGIANEGDKSRDITFIGDGTQTFDVVKNAVTAEGGELNYQRGSSFTFKNMTVQAGEGSYDGIVCDALTYENCTIKGKLTLYGKATFVNCVFDNTMADQYSIWTWGGTDVKFDGCEFNTNGKAILLYGQATAENPTNLTVTNCTFTDRENGAAGKAAVEIGNDYNATYTLNVNGCTINGFAEGKNTGSKVWANKNSMDAAHLSVTIDGTKIQ